MKKTSYTILALALILGLAENLWADTHTAAGCSYADVSAAVTAASAGDTVLVPAGTCIWNSTLILTKHISLIAGSGGATTITYGGGNTMVVINPSDDVNDTLVRFSGFTLDGNNSAGTIMELGQYDRRPPFTMLTRIRVDHNVIKNSSQYGIWNYCTFYGVVDNNTFLNNPYTIKNDTQSLETWNYTSPQMLFQAGSNKYIYFEDNIFSIPSYHGESDSLAVEAQFSGRYAFRYNTFIAQTTAYAFLEQHGHQGSGAEGMGASFGAEIYGNSLTSSNHNTWFKTRGGQSLVFLNNVNASSADMVAYEGSMFSCPDADHYPELQIVHDSYWFMNRIGVTGSIVSAGADSSNDITCPGSKPYGPTIGINIFTDTSSPAVSCGTLANLPGTCTTGQGYWATNQSCANLTGMVGANPASPISGTLYKCTATNTWTAYYTPYTYPHPLRGSTQSSVLYGDISGDSTISAYDASLAAQYAVNLIALTPAQITAADVSGDGTVSAYDASLIAQKAVGLISKFPIEG